MSQIDTMRQAIVTAVKGLAGLEAVDVVGAASLAELWMAKRKPACFVVYRGMISLPAQQRMGQRTETPAEFEWELGIVAESFRGPIDANTKPGGADDLVEALRGIRAVDVALPQKNILLRLQSEELLEPEGRPLDGGPIAYRCRYKTTPVMA